jgi:hypothetical protein
MHKHSYTRTAPQGFRSGPYTVVTNISVYASKGNSTGYTSPSLDWEKRREEKRREEKRREEKRREEKRRETNLDLAITVAK